jgi:hypothetical protein
MASTSNFAATPRLSYATLTGAPGAGFRAGGSATSVVDIMAGGSSGSRVDKVILKHTGTNAAAATASLSVIFFVFDGTNRRMIAEVDVDTVGTPAAGTATFQSTVPILEGLLLPSTAHKLQGVISGWVDTDDDFSVVAIGGDF